MLGGNRTFVLSLVGIALLVGTLPALSTALTAPVRDQGAGGSTDLPWTSVPGPAGAAGWGIGGSSQAMVVSTINAGSYVSHDNGMTWEQTPAGIDEGDIVFDPTDPAVGYYAGFNGLARTTDAGETWELVVETDRARVVAVSPTGTVAVSQRFGTFEVRILVSQDKGGTWEDIGAPLPQFTSLYGLAFGPTDDHLYIMGISESWVTTDGGQTWSHDPDNGGRYLARAPDGTLWRAGFGPLHRSTDAGLTWTDKTAPGTGPMTVSETGRLYIATNDGVIFSDDQAGTWTNMGGGAISWAATGLIVDPSNPGAVVMSDEGVGVTWVGPTGDGGYTLEGRTTGFPPVEVNALDASLDGQVQLAATPAGVYRSSDAGATWIHTGAGIGLADLHTAATADGEHLYAGGQTMIFSPILLASPDGGDTWFGVGPEGNDGVILDLAVDPEDPRHAWAAAWIELSDSSIYETTDGGQSWEPVFTIPEKVRGVAYDESTGTPLAATSVGVFGQDPLTGLWTPRSLAPEGARAVAATGGQVYAEGAGLSLWTGVADATALVPWAGVDGRVAELQADPSVPSTAWAVTDQGELVRCSAETAGIVATCTGTTQADRDPLVQAVMRPPGSGQVVVATPASGLFAASLP